MNRGLRHKCAGFALAGMLIALTGCGEADVPPDGSQFVINRDGTERHLVTDVQGAGYTWSPDGTQIVFATGVTRSGELALDTSAQGGAIVFADGEGRGSRELRVPALPTDLFWAGDRVYFTMRGGVPARPGTWIASIPVAGGEVEKAPLGFAIGDAWWSTDARRLTFSVPSGKRGASRQVWVVDADGRNLRSVVKARGKVHRPTFTPDGSKIAFVVSRAGRQSVWSVRSDGSRLQRLRSNISARTLSWSPNGKELLVTGYRTGQGGVLLGERVERLSADGATLERFEISSSVLPAWSPDRSTVAVVRQEGSRPLESIVLVSANGEEQETITTFGGLEVDGLQWAPGGERLAFGLNPHPDD